MVAVVTGAYGFLGAYISNRLEDDNPKVVRLGRAELDTPGMFADVIDREAVTLVVHCAGAASVGESVKNPRLDYEGSVALLYPLLETIARRIDPPRFLFLSSAAVYGDVARLPIGENSPLDPVSPYGFHRSACEMLIREFNTLFGVPAVVLRVFSAYGEGLRRQILWDICRKAIREDVVSLDGTGLETRDFVHAADVAEAVAIVARHAAFAGETFNVGTGLETSVGELARLLVGSLGVDREIRFSGLTRVGDPRNWRADISALRRLGFEPAVSIKAGAAAYAAWAERELAIP